ncbi:hypothetical protein KP509_02G075000 [Ceratopteris richardii]|uniref:Uncharacterized protein n=1 Tax=Ceratopteris richardii TaxID=49495 RepID=A0A8T2VEF1_CERRI|nr:hypothetical protein KP509_02G075000 [Ceratopteris richardii]
MVGIFSRFSPASYKPGFHRRSRSSPDEKEITSIAKEPQPPVSIHTGQVADEFSPVDHPMEPPENDRPVRCPPPEPCIIHDGRLWKERLQLSIKRRKELPFMREAGLESSHIRRHTSEHSIPTSVSAPADILLKLLDQ